MPVRVLPKLGTASWPADLDARAHSVDGGITPKLPVAPKPQVKRRALAAPVGAMRPVSPREREVLALVAQGLSNKEIATAMSLTEGTAKLHVVRLLRKLSCRNRVELALLVVAGQSREVSHVE